MRALSQPSDRLLVHNAHRIPNSLSVQLPIQCARHPPCGRYTANVYCHTQCACSRTLLFNVVLLHVGAIVPNAHVIPPRFFKFQQGQLLCGMRYGDCPQQENDIWSYGVTVGTLDSESSDCGSNPRRTFTCVHQCRAHGRIVSIQLWDSSQCTFRMALDGRPSN